MDNLTVHSMDMLHVDLPKNSFDFIWSMCAVEHVGTIEQITEAVRQAGELLTDDGVMWISTEFNLSHRPHRTDSTLFLTRADIAQMIHGSGLHVVEPIQLRLSDHPMNTPVWSGLSVEHLALPHVIRRNQTSPLQGCYCGVIAFVLSRKDHGVAMFDEDPFLDRIMERWGNEGRRLNRRLSPPWRWW